MKETILMADLSPISYFMQHLKNCLQLLLW